MSMTKYIWDEEDDVVSMEKDENGATTAVYTHEPGRHGELISQRRGENTSYYHYDGLGSTVALTNESEEVTDTYRYKGFGEPVATTGSTVNPFRWVGGFGYYWDEELGQYYVRARHYGPVTGRFVSQDPSHSPRGANPYAYVSSNPVRGIDPSGLEWIDCIAGCHDRPSPTPPPFGPWIGPAPGPPSPPPLPFWTV